MRLSKTKDYKSHLRFTYEKEDDVLNIWFSKEKNDYADQVEDIIVHFTKDNEPVYL